jgi:hypothetical protein
MLLRIAEVVFFFSISATLHAGDPFYSRFSAGEAGMAYACVSSPGHWNAFHNQAVLPYCNNFSIGSSVEARYMMMEMSSKAITCIIPGKSAPLGLMLTHYGNRQYSVITGGIGSAVILTTGLSLGVQVDFISEHCAGMYADMTYVTFEAGILAKISSHLTFGLHVFNPLAGINSLPSSLSIGLSWEPDKNFIIALDAVKLSDEAVSLRSGVKWILPKGITLCTGYGTYPSSFAFGTGFSSGRLSIDTGFIMNTDTGVTPSVSFLWKFPRK